MALMLVFSSIFPAISEAQTPPAKVSVPAPSSPKVLPPTLPPTILLPTPTPVRPGKSPSVGPSPSPTPNAPKLVTKPPGLSAVSAIAVDADTGRIIYAKELHRRVPMASTTKIMTALTLLSMPGLNLNDQTTIVQDDLVGEANMDLRNGERIKVVTLLIGLLTNSANEAGMAIARYAGAKVPGPADPIARFVALMNSKALAYGMLDSHYSNPHGLDEAGHYSSAYDLAISGWYALHNPSIVSIVGLSSYTFEGHSFWNANSFVRRYPGATGIKPGLTDDAGYCLVASATNYNHTVIVVVLGDATPANQFKDTDTLMDYSFSLLTNRAEPQSTLNGPDAYIGLPQGSKLVPFDVAAFLEYFRSLFTEIGNWLRTILSRSH